MLGFAVPGLGHLYAGLHRRAALIILFFPAAEIVGLVLMVLIPLRGVNVAVSVALVLGARAFVAAHAARATRRMGAEATGDRGGRWYSLLAALVLISTIVDPLWAHAARKTLVAPYRFPAGSMENTILNGDHLLATGWAYGWRLPLVPGVLFGSQPAHRRDLVAFPYPEDPSRTFLKRVIGLPGETVEIRRRAVFIDGAKLEEPYTRFLEPMAEPGDESTGRGQDWGPATVPAGSYFVLGDNRDNSKDSRYWGYVKQGDLLGRARVVYWSMEPGTGRMRWDRIGRRLQQG